MLSLSLHSMSQTHLVARAGWRYQKVVACCTFGPPVQAGAMHRAFPPSSGLLCSFQSGSMRRIPAGLQEPQSRFDVGHGPPECSKTTGEGKCLCSARALEPWCTRRHRARLECGEADESWICRPGCGSRAPPNASNMGAGLPQLLDS